VSSISSAAVFDSRLKNGLRVILKEDHSAPIASIWTWYRVGSRNELPGRTGVSHWVEHMQFKGTPTLAKGQVFRDISRVGGTLNAMTSHDWTAYFETLPIEHLDLAFAIEADRMVNSLFDSNEVESERTVILSERQGAENSPGYALYEEVNGAAFQAHPYRHMVIGYSADLQKISRDDLYQHYRRFYTPANSFIAAVGDFNAEELFHRIDERFSSIPETPLAADRVDVAEPKQPGERRTLIHKPAGAPYLRMAFHAPPARDGDLVPLLVTEAILSGGQPMGFGGGGGMGRSSRLYRALVASGIARSASSDMGVTIDPYLFQIGVTGLPDGDLAQIERVIDDELGRLREQVVPPAELERAIRQLEAQFVFSSEGVTNQAYWLGQWEVVDAWPRALSLPDEIRAVTAADVQRVAERYLNPDYRTVGWLLPTGNAAAVGTNSNETAVFTPPSVWGLSGPEPPAGGAEQIQRAVLSNGIPVLAQERPLSRSISLRMRLPAGSIWEPAGESGLAYLTARSTLRGSGGQTYEAINTRTDELGSSLSIDANQRYVEARVRCLNGDFTEMVNLLAQTLLVPNFPEDEVERVKAEQIGAISESDNDTRASADCMMRRAVYPSPNPLGGRVLGSKESVSKLYADTVRRFHAGVYEPSRASIAVVGGTSGVSQAVMSLEQAFGSWVARSPSQALPDISATNREPVRVTEELSGKSQADLAIGIPTLSRLDDDYYALDIANLVLGRLGLMGRLGAEVRDRQGLAYYASSQIEPRADGSLWAARAGVDPTNVERAIASIEAEIDRIREELISDEEHRDAKSYLTGALPLALESSDGMATMLLAIEEYRLGLDFLTRYPAIIAAISREDVQRVARLHLDPTRRAIAIAMPK
jgi:zinc protease